MKYKKYLNYTDSGVDWIGDIPEKWNISRNKFEFYISKKSVNGNSSYFKLLSMGKKGVNYRDMNNGKGKFPENFDTYQVIEPNDLIFCLFDMDETPRTIGYSNLNGMITSAYDVVKPLPHTNSKFIYYYYLAIDYFKGLRPFYTGLRKVVRHGTFLGLHTIRPSYNEQKQIAEFLDKKTVQFDELIAKYKTQISLLEEERQNILNQTVTKGLDPDIQMKDSGVDWIGDIPVRWKLSKFKFISSKILDGEHNSPKFVDVGIPYISSTHVKKKLHFKKCKFVDKETYEKLIKRCNPEINEILLTVKGTIGFCKMIDIKDKFVMDRNVGLIKPLFEFVDPQFLEYYIKSTKIQNHIQTLIEKSVIPSLYLEKIKNIIFVCPTTVNEQKQIAEFLDKKTVQFDELIAKYKTQISLLEEERQILITSAVTGKIDVRGVIT